MDKSEIHYLTYDADEIYNEMQKAYIEAGGDVLYPGDEKEMLLRAVQSVIVQSFAGVDNALRMATVKYSVRDYLDLKGEDRRCYRLNDQQAKSVVEIKFFATGKTGAIEAGTAVTADGARLYLLDEEVSYSGNQQTIRVGVTANDSGSVGNGLLAGTQMQFLVPLDGVESVYCVSDAEGGQEREEDEPYRQRIRAHGLASVTTGPKVQYEAVAKSVTSEIKDAKSVNIGDGKVGNYLLLTSDTGVDAIIKNVKTALSEIDVRPMTDEVSVFRATGVPYTLNVLYKAKPDMNISAAIAEAVSEYQKKQDGELGKAFDPYELISKIYQAGAVRVVIGEGSTFNGGPAEYTEISEKEHCQGTITLGVIS